MINSITAVFTALIMAFSGSTSQLPQIKSAQTQVISQRQFSLENRYPIESVNEVMKKNILLNLAYLDGSVTSKSDIDWQKVTSPFHFEKTLEPNQTFAYHINVRSEYADSVAFTTNTHFNASDGYLNDGYLYGDGVCHLASLINWAALDADLTTFVPKDHRSVGHIPEVPDEYGVSIYISGQIGANNNLYITNTKDKPISFHFDYDGSNLKVYVTQGA